MVTTPTKAKIARWHRWLGLVLSIPLLGWIVSSAAMMIVTMNAPQGLAGGYELRPYNSQDVPLDGAKVSSSEVLRSLADEHGIDRIFWLRLEARGPHLLYVVKPTPFSLSMVFDAYTGERLDPLPDELLAVTANEALVGTSLVYMEPVQEYNRYYAVDRVPAVRARMEGEYPSWIILSRDEGRTLRRINADANRFTWWYRNFHVIQWSDNILLWTAVLYALAAGVVLLTIFGFQMFWWRRKQRIPVEKAQGIGVRQIHRIAGVVTGVMLILQLGVGAYLWLNLGPLEDPFRGKGSFNPEWEAGFTTNQPIADPTEILQRVSSHLPTSPHPVQSIEWRSFDGRPGWVISSRRNEMGVPFDGITGNPLGVLPPEVAGRIAQQEVIGLASFEYVGESHQLWMDLNRPVPVYHFRFNDPHETDGYVAQASGQIIQRRPAVWRAFSSYLRLHMFSFTRNKAVDMALLALFQVSTVALIVTGWRLQFSWQANKAAAIGVPRFRGRREGE